MRKFVYNESFIYGTSSYPRLIDLLTKTFFILTEDGEVYLENRKEKVSNIETNHICRISEDKEISISKFDVKKRNNMFHIFDIYCETETIWVSRTSNIKSLKYCERIYRIMNKLEKLDKIRLQLYLNNNIKVVVNIDTSLKLATFRFVEENEL